MSLGGSYRRIPESRATAWAGAQDAKINNIKIRLEHLTVVEHS